MSMSTNLKVNYYIRLFKKEKNENCNMAEDNLKANGNNVSSQGSMSIADQIIIMRLKLEYLVFITN